MFDFDNLIDSPRKIPRDELSNYLQAPREKVRDPLKWWKDLEASAPTLSRMARDYLSIPGKHEASQTSPFMTDIGTRDSNDDGC